MPSSQRRVAPLAAVLLGAASTAVAACSTSAADSSNGGDCADRGPPELVVGTGLTSFTEVGSGGLDVVKGVQGGYHVWIGLHAVGLAPHLTVKLAIRDSESGEVLTFDGLQQVVDLAADGDGSEGEEVAGLRGFLKAEVVPSLPGRKVILWASATDACDVSAADEEATFVSEEAPSGGWPEGD